MDAIPASTADALRELRASQPQSADVAVSLGLVLARTGEVAEAVTIVESIAPDERNQPGIAPFCAIIYALAGDDTKSREYAERPAELHFPESQSLLNQALGAGS